MAGFAGLLMAVALTASGCAPAQPPAAGNAPTTAVKVKKVADFDPTMTILDPEWDPAFGQDRAFSTPIATAGLKILSVMFDKHPEYTLGGFVPTDKEWSATVADFKPLVNAKAMQKMESEWSADKTLPVMTSYRSKPDKDGVHGYTYTTEAGEKCTDGDQPYEYKTEGLTLTARPDESGTQVPVFSGNVSLVVHCKEGILLEGQIFAWFPMQKVDGKWIMLDTYEANPTGPFKKMLVVDGT
jgi:hypothetical protein